MGLYTKSLILLILANIGVPTGLILLRRDMNDEIDLPVLIKGPL